MKSGKQRRLEIKQKRLDRTKKTSQQACSSKASRPLNSVDANHGELEHNNTYGPVPLFYVDIPFECRDCGSDELWTAKQQKWWYEVVKGDINSVAIRCKKCRKLEQQRKVEARKVHLDGLTKKHGEQVGL
ncbi:hypothetical protein A9Q99_08800 [Gammaproteobacteria bacterium 45_16_T64]|nr:hypothetical protein A9Q99_08800 [Gammaproteobacteria bacterium 45_16_T64]